MVPAWSRESTGIITNLDYSAVSPRYHTWSHSSDIISYLPFLSHGQTVIEIQQGKRGTTIKSLVRLEPGSNPKQTKSEIDISMFYSFSVTNRLSYIIQIFDS